MKKLALPTEVRSLLSDYTVPDLIEDDLAPNADGKPGPTIW